ncbi:MAG: Hpt domain-containing protein, partial [Burkholderiales bacterium]
MSAQREFDIGPLTWVKSEIDQALSRARHGIEQVAAGDSTQLKSCQAHLHQVTGALQMVGLDGVTRFSEEAEKLLAQLQKQPEKIPTGAPDLIRRAVISIARHLDRLLEVESDVPLNLLPLFKELAQAAGTENISESELFFPDLGLCPPKHPQAHAVAEAELRNFINRQRGEFQRGLLNWLRSPEDMQGMKRMHQALLAIERSQPLPAQRTFWWVASGFIESLVHQRGAAGLHAKQLCAHIDLQIRRLAAGSYKVAERQLREALYFVARCAPVTERIREIKEFYALDSLLPQASAPSGLMEHDTSKVAPLLRDFRDTLGSAKDSWAKYTSGAPDAQPRFREHVTKLIKLSAEISLPPLQKLLEVIKTALARAPAKGEENEALALEMATALLLAENAAENFASPAKELPHQVEAMANRLLAALGEKGQSGELPEVPLLNEITRKAQEKLLMAQVVHEIESNMSHIEQVLDAYFRDTSKRDELAALAPFFRQVLGALNILGLEQALQLLAECQKLVEKFGAAHYHAPAPELELLAEGLSSLGFYIQAVETNQTEREQIITPVLRKLRGEPEPPAAALEEAAPMVTI